LDAGEDLVKLADEKKVDEIIIGVRRRSKVGKLIFGSTAQYVILNAPCPVVSVK
jgi:nucleotide-binding universal stress UspA family protein